ncbi:MAG TPA: proline racemase family protein, partial [Thermoguttaceae bacterium]|nr:proline racemase family protein [Thermoguttaceae bacterium]
VPGVGPLVVDVAFGGAFYAFCRAADVGVGLRVEDNRELIRLGMEIKRAVMRAVPIEHPLEKDLGFLYGTIFVGRAEGPGAHSRNVCIFAEGEVDRSPTGTGVSARCAIHRARGEIALGEPLTVESILGTRFTVKALRTTTCGRLPAVVPEVHGQAHLTGRCEWWFDPDDPLRDGFVIR